MERLSNILREFNDQFGNIEWSDRDRVGEVIAKEIPTRVSSDRAYRNAIKNSGKENARIEHNKVLTRAITEFLTDHTELYRQFHENPSFKQWLSETSFLTTYETTK